MYTDVEAPIKINDHLVNESIYRPKIFYKNVEKKGNELCECGLLKADEKVLDLFDCGEMIKPLAGETFMEVSIPGRSSRSLDTSSINPSTAIRAGAGDGRPITEEELRDVDKKLVRLGKIILKLFNGDSNK